MNRNNQYSWSHVLDIFTHVWNRFISFSGIVTQKSFVGGEGGGQPKPFFWCPPTLPDWSFTSIININTLSGKSGLSD